MSNTIVSSKVFDSPQAALAGLARDGITVAVGGFGLCGIPEQLILALRDSGAKPGGIQLGGRQQPRPAGRQLKQKPIIA